MGDLEVLTCYLMVKDRSPAVYARERKVLARVDGVGHDRLLRRRRRTTALLVANKEAFCPHASKKLGREARGSSVDQACRQAGMGEWDSRAENDSQPSPCAVYRFQESRFVPGSCACRRTGVAEHYNMTLLAREITNSKPRL